MSSTYEFETKDLEYARPAGAPLLARVYLPQGRGPFPALVEVHGGAWTTGDRLMNRVFHEDLARRGVVVATLDFRMPPQARYPLPVADVNLGIRWLKAYAAELRSRVDLVGGLGTSSGGHQLLLNSLQPKRPEFAQLVLAEAPKIEASLAFVVACWPVADPLARYSMVKENGNERLVQAHRAYWPSEEDMAAGNPQLVLERGEPVELPPLLTMQGTSDDNLTPDMAERFARAYRKAGGRAEFERFEGQPHAFVTRDPTGSAATRALAAIRRFIEAETASKVAAEAAK
jgi:acetyl esterase/lipase